MRISIFFVTREPRERSMKTPPTWGYSMKDNDPGLLQIIAAFTYRHFERSVWQFKIKFGVAKQTDSWR
jgi:hypothetical protein